VRRQLRMVLAERARLRPELNTTLLGRTTVDAAYAQLATLDTIDRTAPRWSATIATLSQTIPDEAHLAAIRTRGDSLIIDGLADHAARVFDALSKTRGLADVKSAASVRRAAEEGGGAKEHFTIAARVEQPAARKATP
jgi:Tfp pilus assembly protein PilN